MTDNVRSTDQPPAKLESQNDLTLDIMTDLQEKINKLEIEKDELVKALNQFRLGLFIPKITDPLDVNPVAARMTFSIYEVLKETDGYEKAGLYHKLFLTMAARVSDLREEYRGKESIKIRIDKDDKAKKAEVKKIRESGTPQAKTAKLMLTAAEKAVNSIRKKYPMVTQTNLVPIVKAFQPGMDEAMIRETLESIFAKEVQAAKR